MKKLWVGLTGLCALFAQDVARSTFEVASVRSVPIPPEARSVDPTCINGNYHAPLRGVAASIRFAYNLRTDQLSGMPPWASKSDAAYDIEAKPAGPVSEMQCRLMVQALLADRFKLAVHRESKMRSVMLLEQVKSGAKLQPWTPGQEGNPVELNHVSGYHSENGWTMGQFTEFAARFFPDSLVLDRTGLEGAYRIKLEFAIPRPPTDPSDEFQSAVERQMGLKFESKKEASEIVVVDHIERPRAN
jgi:uncharacterized protein (TIGR03435 family)